MLNETNILLFFILIAREANTKWVHQRIRTPTKWLIFGYSRLCYVYESIRLFPEHIETLMQFSIHYTILGVSMNAVNIRRLQSHIEKCVNATKTFNFENYIYFCLSVLRTRAEFQRTISYCIHFSKCSVRRKICYTQFYATIHLVGASSEHPYDIISTNNHNNNDENTCLKYIAG